MAQETEESSDSQLNSFGGAYSAFAITEDGKCLEVHACSREIADRFVRDNPGARVRDNFGWH